MKLHMYALGGALLLAGCADTPAPAQPFAIEMVEPLTLTPIHVAPEQKATYYAQYEEIIERINGIGYDVELQLQPLAKFGDNDWLDAAQFEQLAKSRAQAKMIVQANEQPVSPLLVPKFSTLQTDNFEASIRFEGSFNTQLSENTEAGRQLFDAFYSITSAAVNEHATWTQLGFDTTLSADKTTYTVSVDGTYSEYGISSSHIIEIPFVCDEFGGIS
ncbi:MAG: hypothetical protein UHX00_15375 [Caryophanon sp.]|nr:hypothetical protein [Caryophanon sp.]